ncbi:hypothetical protein D3C76_430560 [compost metagenome]
MPNQAASVTRTISGTHTKAAFCSHSAPPSASSLGAPPAAPNRPTPITIGTTNCIPETPRLPSPAFRPNAVPCWALGKKKLMLDIDEAKLPPPKPHSKAMITNTL